MGGAHADGSAPLVLVGRIEGDQERVAARRQRAATEVDAPGVAASEDDGPRRVCRDAADREVGAAAAEPFVILRDLR